MMNFKNIKNFKYSTEDPEDGKNSGKNVDSFSQKKRV